MQSRWGLIADSSLPALAILYAVLYGAFGTETPFFPSFLMARGLPAEGIGIVLAVGTLVRLVAGPPVGFAADLFGGRRVLAITAAGAGTLILFYLLSTGFWPLLLVSMVHSIAIAPLAPLADALAVAASARERVFSYGWVRGIGSAGFVVGTMISGLIVAALGIDSIIVAAGLLFLFMIPPILFLSPAQPARAANAWKAMVGLFVDPLFRRLLLVSGLVIGSHAMSDAFAVIEWRKAGIGSTTVGILWSEAVASEIVVFFGLGPLLLEKIGPGSCAALAAAAGVVRWATVAQGMTVAVLGATQLLHGLTFSLMHLACMRVIADVVPRNVAASAQTIYGTLSLGIASATLTFLSGEVYGSLGRHAFWMMAALCLLALPLSFKLGVKESDLAC